MFLYPLYVPRLRRLAVAINVRAVCFSQQAIRGNPFDNPFAILGSRHGRVDGKKVPCSHRFVENTKRSAIPVKDGGANLIFSQCVQHGCFCAARMEGYEFRLFCNLFRDESEGFDLDTLGRFSFA